MLIVCEKCGRHVKRLDATCPFCRRTLRSHGGAIGLAGAVAMTVGLGSAACNGNVEVLGGNGGTGGFGGRAASAGGYGGMSATGATSTSSSSTEWFGGADAGYGPPICLMEGNCVVFYGPAIFPDASSSRDADDGLDANADGSLDAGVRALDAGNGG